MTSLHEEPSEPPGEFYVFVDPSNLIAQNNLRFTRRFTSGLAGASAQEWQAYRSGELDLLPYIVNPHHSPWLSVFTASVIADWCVENDAEVIRREEFRHQPSRLSATFAFGDEASCGAASALYGWNLGEVRRFRPIEDARLRIARVNMERVSLARRWYRIADRSDEEIDAYWREYWSERGETAMDLPAAEPGDRQIIRSGLIWEYLVDGTLELVD